MRPYKGLDVLLDAWGEGLDGAELWIVGMPRMDISELRARAPASVRFDERFVADEELPGLFARAQLVVLPYREIEASGVLFTALAFGRPLLLSDVGASPSSPPRAPPGCSRPAAREALRAALQELLADRERAGARWPQRARRRPRPVLLAAGGQADARRSTRCSC